jgi:hypothetical protein
MKNERVFEGAGINPNAAAAAQVCRMLSSRQAHAPKRLGDLWEQTTDLEDPFPPLFRWSTGQARPDVQRSTSAPLLELQRC